MIIILLALAIKTSRDNNQILNDEKVLKSVKKEMYNDGIDHYELESVTSLGTKNFTSVIVNTGFMEIALEIDNKMGDVISKERIARQWLNKSKIFFYSV